MSNVPRTVVLDGQPIPQLAPISQSNIPQQAPVFSGQVVNQQRIVTQQQISSQVIQGQSFQQAPRQPLLINQPQYQPLQQSYQQPISTGPQLVATQIIGQQEGIKGESRIEYVPYERTLTEYEEVRRQVQVPVTRQITEYQAIEYVTEYIPQVIQEKIIEYQPVESYKERIEYQTYTKQNILSYGNQSQEIYQSVPTQQVIYSQQPAQEIVYQQPAQEVVYQQPVQSVVYQQQTTQALPVPKQQVVYTPPPQQVVYQQPQQVIQAAVPPPKQQVVYSQPPQQVVYAQQPQQVVYQQPTQPIVYQQPQQVGPAPTLRTSQTVNQVPGQVLQTTLPPATQIRTLPQGYVPQTVQTVPGAPQAIYPNSQPHYHVPTPAQKTSNQHPAQPQQSQKPPAVEKKDKNFLEKLFE